MYNHNDNYLKFCILCSIVLTIQKVCRLDFLQAPRRRCGHTLSHRQKQKLCEWRRHKNRWKIVSVLRFVVKRVLNRIWDWLKVFRYKLEFTQMVFDSILQCVTRGIQHITERESKNTFELFCQGPLSCWKGNKSQKTSSVTWQYKCLQ